MPMLRPLLPLAPLRPLPRLLIGVALFQAAWFVCVIGAARGAVGVGITAVAASVAWQLAVSTRRGADLRLMAVALGIGALWDSALAQAQVVSYHSAGPWPGWVAPAWILALWVQLGSVLREPLGGLHGRPLWAAAFGGIGGAASYAGAARLGACSFNEPVTAGAVLAIGWAVLMPSLLALARRLDRTPA